VVPDSEASLLDQAKAGDARAFARLVECYWPRLHRWLYLLTRQEQVAEDLTQEAFLRAWRSLATLQDTPRFRSWLFAIARNCLTDCQRGPRGRPPEPLSDAIATAVRGPLEEIVDRETCQRIQAEFERLPLPYRSALALWTQERMSYAEVAEAIGTTEETARWRVCKARQMLQERLAVYLEQTSS
jgi:RNA polymerase sigma-70 factor (ECF subfamily)